MIDLCFGEMEIERNLLCLRHISCRDLDSSYLKLLINYSFYTTVTLTGGVDNHRQRQRKTNMVVAEGRDLRWEQETLELEIFSEEKHIYLEFEFFCHYGVFPLKDTSVGKAVVPIKDLMEKQHGSLGYQVRSTCGGSNDGALTFLFHVMPEPAMTGEGSSIPPSTDVDCGQPSSVQSYYSYPPPAAPNEYYCCYYTPLPPQPPPAEGYRHQQPAEGYWHQQPPAEGYWHQQSPAEGYWHEPPPIWPPAEYSQPSQTDSCGSCRYYYHYE